ncbi:hypothetical protein SAMN05518855_100183 [Paenibacillus sp. CF384]|nr:hypothetical protein SAMN05518855_100183 [Paenibacillus sp. CF384]
MDENRKWLAKWRQVDKDAASGEEKLTYARGGSI